MKYTSGFKRPVFDCSTTLRLKHNAQLRLGDCNFTFEAFLPRLPLDQQAQSIQHIMQTMLSLNPGMYS